ncbi:Pimeloyl-ACP methyl ester carboxylesterase [Amycolatopsis marina]|uniref:Pimeloyl-ACP methyl ester carboxylesterase n=1 Tax=Amycolatopsis marina TaxID=490629 RepID=A0A1I1BM81_9PSEU|nr:alpha/beta hydrolase [Amycolatopsis marina]SFB51465.1 Pimeloyl-ACP methyl ester carboxylesterase [Amycolatopsis marina]
MTETGRVSTAAQLTTHNGARIDLPGPYGPIAALRGAEPAGTAKGTVLLVPGYTGSKEDFAPLLDGCSAAGFLAVTVDLPGQYESPGPDDESAYQPAALGQVVADLVAHLGANGGPVLLLGHSFGGLVVRGAVLAGARIAGLTLLGSGPGRLAEGMRRDALDTGEPLLRTEGPEAAYAVRERVNARFPAWQATPAALKEFLRTRFVASSASGLLGMAQALRTEPDLVDALARALRGSGTPGLVVAGEHDDAWSVPEQREMAGRLGAGFALVENAAHSPNTENPAALLNILVATWRSWLSPTS